jgi:hypothetical protein
MLRQHCGAPSHACSTAGVSSRERCGRVHFDKRTLRQLRRYRLRSRAAGEPAQPTDSAVTKGQRVETAVWTRAGHRCAHAHCRHHVARRDRLARPSDEKRGRRARTCGPARRPPTCMSRCRSFARGGGQAARVGGAGGDGAGGDVRDDDAARRGTGPDIALRTAALAHSAAAAEEAGLRQTQVHCPATPVCRHCNTHTRTLICRVAASGPAG